MTVIDQYITDHYKVQEDIILAKNIGISIEDVVGRRNRLNLLRETVDYDNQTVIDEIDLLERYLKTNPGENVTLIANQRLDMLRKLYLPNKEKGEYEYGKKYKYKAYRKKHRRQYPSYSDSFRSSRTGSDRTVSNI